MLAPVRSPYVVPLKFAMAPLAMFSRWRCVDINIAIRVCIHHARFTASVVSQSGLAFTAAETAKLYSVQGWCSDAVACIHLHQFYITVLCSAITSSLLQFSLRNNSPTCITG